MAKFCVVAILVCVAQGCLVYAHEDLSGKNWDFLVDKVEDEVADEEKVDPCVDRNNIHEESYVDGSIATWQECAQLCQRTLLGCKRWTFLKKGACLITTVKAYSGLKGCGAEPSEQGECPSRRPYSWSGGRMCCRITFGRIHSYTCQRKNAFEETNEKCCPGRINTRPCPKKQCSDHRSIKSRKLGRYGSYA